MESQIGVWLLERRAWKMIKEEMKKYMLLKKEGEGKAQVYRILELGEKILVIDCMKKTMPVWKDYDAFSDFIEAEVNENNLESIEDLDADSRKLAYQRYNMIAEIMPFLSNECMRSETIAKVAKHYNISKQTVRSYLCEYLASMDIRSLAPKKRTYDRPLTEFEKTMRKSLNKWYYKPQKRTLKNCYLLMLKNYFCDESGNLLSSYPSYYQYRYFFRRYNKKETEYISRNGLSSYLRNQRPLIGDGVQAWAKSIGIGLLDSTVGDIYLVNKSKKLIGRPILTLCVDAFSGLICGYSIGIESGMYAIRDLLLNVIEDKVAHCKKHGIEITEEQWPCKKLPLKLVTDQGSEYRGFVFEQITDLGTELLNLKSFAPDKKGSVEVSFSAVQNYFKPILKGSGTIEPDFRERGSHDYRKDAKLTLEDFRKVIIHCIVYYNSNRIMENFPFSEEMLGDKVRPIPCHIWKWASEYLGENLMDVKKDTLLKVLLPRTMGRFTRHGLFVNGLHYHNDLYMEAYLQGKECQVAYDIDSTNHVWVIENGKYILFNLIEKRFKNKSLDDVQMMKDKQKELVKQELGQKTQAEIDLISSIQLIADSARTRSQAELSIKGIRENRSRERIKEHKNFVKEVIESE